MRTADGYEERAGYIVFPLAALAYGDRGQLRNRSKAALWHAYNPTLDKVLCGKVKPENILDDYTMTKDAPTCPACAKKWAKLV